MSKATRSPGLPSDAVTVQAETRLVGKMIEALNKRPLTKARKVHGSRYQDKGEPDIDACSRGRAVKIEVKMPGQVPTPIQMKRLRDWAAAGALVGWVTSLDELDELMGHVTDPAWVNPQLSP